MSSMSQSYRSRRGSPGLLRARFQVVLLLWLIWTGAIVLKLVYLQILQHDYYLARAKRQRQSIVTLDPERGPILDRKGRQLAISVAVESIYGIPEEMSDPETELRTISRFTKVDVKELLAHSRNKSFLWIARKITRETADRIKELQLPGVYFTQESRRYYPNKELAAHVLGFVGMDNKGLSGVEYQYDHVVCGVPGKLSALRDAKRRLLLSEKASVPAVGRTLQLTIDSAIQHIAEEELKAAVQEQNANGGAVIIMNPFNGEILALANEPSFNPNAYIQYKATRWKNKAIQDYYEPGSTFKPVIVTAALDLGLVQPDDLFDCQMGSITLARGHVMEDHKSFGILSLRQIISKSSNVGMIKVGLKVGPRSLFEYANAFGFGKKTGIDLPGEAPGLVRPPEKWSAISIGAFSIGQELGVTAVQVLRMMSAISNGGYLPAPHCVAKISDSSGNLKPTVFAQPQPLPVQHNTILTLQELVEAVVQPGGSGTLAQIPGYRVAGKTGTAQRIGTSGTYVDGGYFASFVGYAPAQNPAFSMIVLLDGPKKEHYGGRVAAPLFRKIGQQVLKYLDIPPDQVTENPVLQAESAFPRVTEANLFPEGIEPVAYTPPEQHHKLAIAGDDGKASELVMPSLYGKTMGETVEILSKTKAQFRLLGSGTVTKQWPFPGALLNHEDVCIITLESLSPNSSVANLNVLRK